MVRVTSASRFESGDEDRLAEFGLSTQIFHDALRPGASRANNRSSLALDSSAGTDIYHDGMENLHRILRPTGWNLIPVEKQPRMVHPEGRVSFTVSAAANVGETNVRLPRTRKKGPATRNSLAVLKPVPGLFPDIDAELLAHWQAVERKAPFYFLLCERVLRGGNGLALEFSRPAHMTEGGSVNGWTERNRVGYLDLDGDLDVFDDPDEDEDGIDVRVEPR